MIFNRKIYEELLKWKESNAKTTNEKQALLLEGARRVGKSTIVEEFAKNEYKTYILIDFSEMNTDIKECFENYQNNLDVFYDRLSALDKRQTPLLPHESVIIFDEIQKFPQAREAITHLAKDGQYDFIETGSLISITDSAKDILVPANERRIKMYPMDFEEFCWALGKEESELISEIRNKFSKKAEMDKDNHRKALHIFREYMFVGGMPQSVSAFIDSGKNTKNLQSVETVKRNILELYQYDISKSRQTNRQEIALVFNHITGLLSKHEQNLDTYKDACKWLAEAMICNICYKCSEPSTLIPLNADISSSKCYMGDTGLLYSLVLGENTHQDEGIYAKIVNDKLHINEGMIYENIVSQMLVSAGHKNLYFFSQQSDGDSNTHGMEVDFLITRYTNQNYRLCPIEVKSETGYKAKSLHLFKEKYKNMVDTSIVILPDNLHEDKENRILYVPPYMAFCL